MSEARKQLNALMKALTDAGTKRREIAHVLFRRSYTEKQVGELMGIHHKSAHAMKTDFSIAGRKKWGNGRRTQMDMSKTQLKRLDGRKMTAQLYELSDKVLAEIDSKRDGKK